MNGIGMDIPLYRVCYISKVSIDRFKNYRRDDEKNRIFSITGVEDNIRLSLDVKNRQFANQLICGSIAQCTTKYGQKDRKITADISDELLADERYKKDVKWNSQLGFS